MLINKLEKYLCFNEQEIRDKKIMIDFIKNNHNYLDRNNLIGHFTASCFIVDKKFEHLLFAYHNIYDSYGWLGGHADNEEDLLKVSIKEAKEEANLNNITIVDEDIFSIEIIPVYGHIKNNQYVSSHLHLNITYLLMASLDDSIKPKLDENQDVKWFKIDEALKYVNETWMVENVYKKLIAKINLKYKK